MRFLYVKTESEKDFVAPWTPDLWDDVQDGDSLGNVSFYMDFHVDISNKQDEDFAVLDSVLNIARRFLGRRYEVMDKLTKEFYITEINRLRKQWIDNLLLHTDGNLSLAAKISGFNRKTLLRMKEGTVDFGLLEG